ncbi:MAG: DNA alkylation repair protein [Nitrososphaerales archaeon]
MNLQKDRNSKTQLALERLRSLGDPLTVSGMARFGINTKSAYGVSVPKIRSVTKEIGKDHKLALKLWSSGVHEARLLAAMIDDPKLVTEKQMESWVSDFDSWDVCDCCCGTLFDKTEFAYEKAIEWSSRQEEFVRRAGFVLMAELAVHDKKADDETFVKFLRIIGRSDDERNFVKKSINWSLRQIGKRNTPLNLLAIETAMKLREKGSKSSHWIASDALRELREKKVQKVYFRVKNRRVLFEKY